MAVPVTYFVSNKKFYKAEAGKPVELESEYLEKFKDNVAQIHKRSAWKKSGEGAKFMGAMAFPELMDADLVAAAITGVASIAEDKLVYALNTEGSSGLYTKNPRDLGEMEGFIVRKNDLAIYEMDYSPETGEIIASVSEDRVTRSLALFHEDSAQYQIWTEGEAMDQNPFFSRKDCNVVLYDTCGLMMNEYHMPVGNSRRSVLALDLRTGNMDELVDEEGFDCFKPKDDREGNLYYIKRPVQDLEKQKTSVKDVAMMPGKVGKALFGWLNFFTQRYSGEALSSSGSNASKAKQKSNEEIFIEGNLVNVEKNLKENTGLKEKYPGVAPKTWELIRKAPDGTLAVLKKGVLDFNLDGEGNVVYSNGRHLIKLFAEGSEEMICEANLATCIQIGR